MPHILHLAIATVLTVALAWAVVAVLLVAYDVLTYQPAENEGGETR